MQHSPHTTHSAHSDCATVGAADALLQIVAAVVAAEVLLVVAAPQMNGRSGFMWRGRSRMTVAECSTGVGGSGYGGDTVSMLMLLVLLVAPNISLDAIPVVYGFHTSENKP